MYVGLCTSTIEERNFNVTKTTNVQMRLEEMKRRVFLKILYLLTKVQLEEIKRRAFVKRLLIDFDGGKHIVVVIGLFSLLLY